MVAYRTTSSVGAYGIGSNDFLFTPKNELWIINVRGKTEFVALNVKALWIIDLKK